MRAGAVGGFSKATGCVKTFKKGNLCKAQRAVGESTFSGGEPFKKDIERRKGEVLEWKDQPTAGRRTIFLPAYCNLG